MITTMHPISKFNETHGRIFLYGEIDDKIAFRIIQKMRYFYLNNKTEDIYLYIHSDGGDFEAMCAILDEMKGLQSLGAKIYTIAVGKAASAAACVLAMGTERYATPNTTIMMHEMQVHWEWNGESVKNVKGDTEFMEKLYTHTISMIAERCGHKGKKKPAFIEKISKVMWMLPKDAQREGIIDGIWDYNWEKVNDQSSDE